MLNYANTGGGESDTHREKKTQDALDWKGMTVMMVCVCGGGGWDMWFCIVTDATKCI